MDEYADIDAVVQDGMSQLGTVGDDVDIERELDAMLLET